MQRCASETLFLQHGKALGVSLAQPQTLLHVLPTQSGKSAQPIRRKRERLFEVNQHRDQAIVAARQDNRQNSRLPHHCQRRSGIRRAQQLLHLLPDTFGRKRF